MESNNYFTFNYSIEYTLIKYKCPVEIRYYVRISGFGLDSFIYKQFYVYTSVVNICSSFLFFKLWLFINGLNSYILLEFKNNSPASGHVISSELILFSCLTQRIFIIL